MQTSGISPSSYGLLCSCEHALDNVILISALLVCPLSSNCASNFDLLPTPPDSCPFNGGSPIFNSISPPPPYIHYYGNGCFMVSDVRQLGKHEVSHFNRCQLKHYPISACDFCDQQPTSSHGLECRSLISYYYVLESSLRIMDPPCPPPSPCNRTEL